MTITEICKLLKTDKIESILIKLRVFDILPYFVLVGILIFAICRIKSMVNDVNIFRTKNSFICFMLLCFISFVLNWLFIFPVSVFYKKEENSDNSSKKIEKI